MPVPEDYLNKNFGELFNYLSLERNLIPLALYRLPGAVDNKHPYVYTNPPPDTKLTHRDKVFVLAHQLPNDLSNYSILYHKDGGPEFDIKSENLTKKGNEKDRILGDSK